MIRHLFFSIVLGVGMAVALPMEPMGFNQTAEAQSLSNACKRVYAQYNSRRGPKAFAVTTRGGCGSAWAQPSLARAQAVAMNGCRRNGTGCRVVESSF
jgi:hypothetical protein